MLDAYAKLLGSSEDDRRGAYEATSVRLGTSGAFVEKDLWVCLALNFLFGAKKPPCAMTFKGGTSLSKAYGLIQRFSEDIDIVLAPEGLGMELDIERMQEASLKQQQKMLEALRAATENYVGMHLKSHIEVLLAEASMQGAVIIVDPDEKQDLLLSYPSVYADTSGYVHPTVRIECGPRSAHEPSNLRSISPYIGLDVSLDLAIADVQTIAAERTFIEKIFILHGHHCRFRDAGVIPVERNRLSRHYYDVALLMNTEVAANALTGTALLDTVRSRNKVTFPAAWRKYDEGVPGTFLVVPQQEVQRALEDDYASMQSMVFGEIPPFSWIVEQTQRLQERLNAL